MTEVLIFTYGTLRKGAGHAMFRLLAAHGRRLGPATCRGVLLDVGPYPAALASDRPEDLIHGEVHAVRAADAPEVLDRLDRYEGCPGGEPGPALYVRERLDVTLQDGRVLSAWVWLWNRSAVDLPRIGHGDWLRHLKER